MQRILGSLCIEDTSFMATNTYILNNIFMLNISATFLKHKSKEQNDRKVIFGLAKVFKPFFWLFVKIW